jgi:membrane-associated phospholipid phosphatase
MPAQTNLQQWWREGAVVWQLGWARLRPRLWIILVIIAAGTLAVLFEKSWDERLLNQIRVQQDSPYYCPASIHVPGTSLSYAVPPLDSVAGQVSHWGDEHWSLPLVILIWGAGAVFNRKRWRQLGWACLLAFLVATVAVDVFRCGLGRARPNSGLPDGFYGPHIATQYQSFPSGHATTSFATALSLASASPVLSVPCTVYAVTVGWSRMQLNRHHPVDVLTGAVLGSFIGLCFAGALPGRHYHMRRRKKRSARQL